MKTVTLYRPFTIENALQDFDKYMEAFFPASRASSQLPAVDIRENDSAYTLEAELPGYDEKNLQVHVNGGLLTIESKKEEAGAEKGEGGYLVQERRRSSFSRSFKLPENADSGQISAVFRNGVLNLEIKKRPETQKRAIAIERG
jgi:HSP20 family protein